MTGIDRLHPGVVHHIVNTLGWSSLRPLQEAAIEPLVDGADALLLAPTAGGKTEAAVFPMLTAMIDNGWRGLSVLYVCPLRALLNNLHPRLDGYARWVGRSTGLWHGDTSQTQRRRRRPRLASARRAGAAGPARSPPVAAHRPVRHRRQPGRVGELAARTWGRPPPIGGARAARFGGYSRAGGRPRLRGQHPQRRDRHRRAAPGREATGLLRDPKP